MKTRNDIILTATKDYLNNLEPGDQPSPSEVEFHVLTAIQEAFDASDDDEEKSVKQKKTNKKSKNNKTTKAASFAVLPPLSIGEILLHFYHVKLISFTGDMTRSPQHALAFYQSKGPDKGVYITSESELRALARQYHASINLREFNEVLAYLQDKAEVVCRCSNANYIAVNNGIFDYKEKKLLPFSPKYVFTSKSYINYNPQAEDVSIPNPDGKRWREDSDDDWSVEAWMNYLSDDKDIVQLLWEILGAAIRPSISWDKSAFLYAKCGNNGKGTFCHLMRQLCGERTCVSLPLSSFSKDFHLEPLIHASAIITDENDVGVFIDQAATLKAIITHDMFEINIKHKTPITFRFNGFMVQCVNELPRIRDHSESLYRRLLLVPFDKSFTGNEFPYIKGDYLKRPDVLEYVLFRVLNMNYYSLSEPKACRELLNEYKNYNDPMRTFANEMFPRFAWDFLPSAFLYDLYKEWHKRFNPSGKPLGRNTFLSELKELLPPDWSFDNAKQFRASTIGKLMTSPEPLINEYNLNDWKNKECAGNDKSQICTFVPKQNYRGIIKNHEKDKKNEENRESKKKGA